MNGMTQHRTKINGPYSDLLVRRTMDDRGRRGVWISDTLPPGRRATVGGSEGLADWPCAPGALDNPPGGVWIDFIRGIAGDSQSIVAVPVTGSLVSPTLFSRRDADYFGVELYVPWDAPEMAIDLTSSGTVPLRNVPDVFRMSGRRDSATQSRILQGRDARSVRVLVPDCRGLEQNFHDVMVVDMGDLPESEVSIPELSELAR